MVDAKGAVDFSDVIAGTYDILAASSTQRIQWFASLLRLDNFRTLIERAGGSVAHVCIVTGRRIGHSRRLREARWKRSGRGR